jgi:hypothetical protein
VGLFTADVRAVRIPMLQRDYAQGRSDPAASRIRADFVTSLHDALTGDKALSLDFVFGSREGDRFVPLDGQQRLTTLFLLHAYLAARLGIDAGQAAWASFSYETRPSAREFCRELTQRRPPFPLATVSGWITDQPWFQSTWRHDPTVVSMLTMLDAVHERLRDIDCASAWARLTDAARPAVTFHVLGLEGMGPSDTVYIRMNARGVPLTPFENFKALMEHALGLVDPTRASEFAKKIDGAWCDTLWSMRDKGKDAIDDEFMRYLHFVTNVATWESGASPAGDPVARALSRFGDAGPGGVAARTLLFDAFDCWAPGAARAFFETHLAAGGHQPGKLTLHDRGTVDLLASCCRAYGNPAFTLQRTLLLFAAVVHRAGMTGDFPRRLRVLRNLIEASADGLRAEAMPTLLASVRRYVVDGNLAAIAGFHRGQLDDEIAKEAFLAANPALELALFALEDHPLLRGCLAAFSLDAALFTARAVAFERVFADSSAWDELTGALLACGDYGQTLRNDRWRLGSSSDPEVWRALLARPDRGAVAGLRAALGALLDHVAVAEGSLVEALRGVSDAWLADREAAGEFDWRYYLVKYPAMRDGASGVYVDPFRHGYDLCMLRGSKLSGYYRDPYLLASWRLSGVDAARAPDRWFRGYEERWLPLAISGASLRFVGKGIELHAPPASAHRALFDEVCATHGVGPDLLLTVSQVDRGGALIDTRDRVALGAALIRALIDGGL